METILQDTNFWLCVSFAAFVYVCWRYGKMPVLATLDNHISSVQKELDTAETLRVESQELLAQYERKHRETEKESEKIIAQARNRAEHIRAQGHAEREEMLARREKQLMDRMDRMQRAAHNEVKSYASRLAMDSTRAIIGQKMTNKTAGTLIDNAINEISGKS